jgi:hypothetical protein
MSDKDRREDVRKLARQLYLKLPWWKRATYRKWKKSNNWDVKDIYSRCLREAKEIISDEETFNL